MDTPKPTVHLTMSALFVVNSIILSNVRNQKHMPHLDDATLAMVIIPQIIGAALYMQNSNAEQRMFNLHTPARTEEQLYGNIPNEHVTAFTKWISWSRHIHETESLVDNQWPCFLTYGRCDNFAAFNNYKIDLAVMRMWEIRVKYSLRPWQSSYSCATYSVTLIQQI